MISGTRGSIFSNHLQPAETRKVVGREKLLIKVVLAIDGVTIFNQRFHIPSIKSKIRTKFEAKSRDAWHDPVLGAA